MQIQLYNVTGLICEHKTFQTFLTVDYFLVRHDRYFSLKKDQPNPFFLQSLYVSGKLSTYPS